MKPSLPQGTRDFGPDVVKKRQYIFSIIRSVFELYGFQPLETPAMENLETLMGKYGDEGDKLIFKILNNGLDNPAKLEAATVAFAQVLKGKSTASLTERALRYDLTIPFARYIAMNHGRLSFPFKRYQMQPVWRADRPQRGRYREFYQCDADIIGSNALVNEVEFIHIYHDVFTQLNLPQWSLQLNSRKILSALAEISGGLHKMVDITVAIDKLDKIGLDRVREELLEKELSADAILVIENYLGIKGSNEEKLNSIRTLFQHSGTGQEGIAELEFVLDRVKDSGIRAASIQIDLTLARGLNYYTGLIFEAKGPATVKMGSIGGGGRYDDLTGLFGVPNIPGVGISFGVDRIYDVLEELDLFPATVAQGTKVLFFNFGDEEARTIYKLVHEARHKGIAAELFPEPVKSDKQFRYAEKRNIPFVVLIGKKELEADQAVLKNILTGNQQTLPINQLIWELENLTV